HCSLGAHNPVCFPVVVDHDLAEGKHLRLLVGAGADPLVRLADLHCALRRIDACLSYLCEILYSNKFVGSSQALLGLLEQSLATADTRAIRFWRSRTSRLRNAQVYFLHLPKG